MKIRIEEMVSCIGIGKHLFAAILCMLIASQVSGSALTVRRRTSISPRFGLAETRKLIAGRMEDAAVVAVTGLVDIYLSGKYSPHLPKLRVSANLSPTETTENKPQACVAPLLNPFPGGAS